MRFLVVFALAAVLTGSAMAATSSLPFTNGALVARKMEAHYNGAAYKARIAKADAKLLSRILCGYDSAIREVDCTGRLRIKGYAVDGEWTLDKLARTRAMLRWTFTGKGIFQAQHAIVTPRAFGLRSF